MCHWSGHNRWCLGKMLFSCSKWRRGTLFLTWREHFCILFFIILKKNLVGFVKETEPLAIFLGFAYMILLKSLPLLSWSCFILSPGRVQVQHTFRIWHTQATFLFRYVTIYIADTMMDQILNQSYSKILPPNDLITWGFINASFYLAVIRIRFFFLCEQLSSQCNDKNPSTQKCFTARWIFFFFLLLLIKIKAVTMITCHNWNDDFPICTAITRVLKLSSTGKNRLIFSRPCYYFFFFQ